VFPEIENYSLIDLRHWQSHNRQLGIVSALAVKRDLSRDFRDASSI